MVPRVLFVSRVNSNIDISMVPQTNNGVVIIDNAEQVNVIQLKCQFFNCVFPLLASAFSLRYKSMNIKYDSPARI